MTRTMRAALAVTAALLLTGCATEEGAPSTGPAPEGTNRPTEATSGEPTPSSEPPSPEPVEEPTSEEPTTEAPTNPVFGETYTWENEVSVTIGAPAPFEPSESAAGVGDGAHVIFDITVVNGSDANYEPGQLYVTAQSGNVEASQVFDSAQDLGGSPSTVLLPGREAVFRLAFAVADPADIVMEVTPGFEYEAAIFTT